MSATTDTTTPFLQNATSTVTDTITALLEATTSLENLTNINVSHSGEEIRRRVVLSFDWLIYRYSHWGIVLVIAAMGIIGNSLMFVSIKNKKQNSFSYSTYLRVLAFSDTLVLLLVLMEDTEMTYPLQRLTLINDSMCKIITTLKLFATNLSAWLVVALSLDRYIYICFSTKRWEICTRKHAVFTCSILTAVFVILTLPFLLTSKIIRGQCFPPVELMFYYMFIRLILVSYLPCFCILLFNLLTLLQIMTDRRVRKPRSMAIIASATDQDIPNRPLVLISALAFATLLPISISEGLDIYLKMFAMDLKSFAINNILLSVFRLIYVLNFGQKFYILVASSSAYRKIIKSRLANCKKKRTRTSAREAGGEIDIAPEPSVSVIGILSLSAPDAKSDDVIPTTKSDITVAAS